MGSVEDRFVVDSGATSHMVKDDYETLSKPLQGEIGGKTKIVAIARGRVGVLRNVLYVPQLARNLVSVKQLTDDGHKIIYEGERVMLGDCIGQCTMIGGLFSLI